MNTGMTKICTRAKNFNKESDVAMLFIGIQCMH